MSEANFGHEIEEAPSRPEGSELQDTVTTEPKVDQERSSSPEAKIAQAEKVIADMREWLTQDGTYSTEQIDNILSELTVEYDNDTDQAITSGDLNLYYLTSAEGLTFPQSVGGDLYLQSLTSAEGLTLPQSVGGGFYFESLTSAEGLTLPQSVGGDLNLSSLTHEDRQKLREQRPDLADKIKDEKIPSYGSPELTTGDSPPPPPKGPELTVEEAPAKFNELYQRLLRAMPIEGLSLSDGGITYNYEKNGGDVKLTLVSNEVNVSIRKSERAASGDNSASLFISTNAQGANTAEFNFISDGQLRQVNLDPDQTSEVINTVYAQMLELAVKGEESHGQREAEAKQQVDSALKDFLS